LAFSSSSCVLSLWHFIYKLTASLAVFDFYLSFMTDFFQLWLRLAAVIYVHVYSPHGLCHIDPTRMHIPRSSLSNR
jgi:hypothetical protein